MKAVYFDCFAGIAGDMTIAGLLELGLPLEVLEEGLRPLPLSGYSLEASRVQRHGIGGTSFRVSLSRPDQPHRHYGDIAEMIDAAPLPEKAKGTAQRIFERIALAEAEVHGVPPERVHFHEVGAVDSIVDIVGVAIGLDYLGIEKVFSSPLPYGHGFVQTAHGKLPVPAPATMLLMRGIPLGPDIGPGERVTPTGAAIVATLAQSFGPPPPLTPERIGYGAGTKDFPELPNLLRLVLGELKDEGDREEVLVIETHIDDMNPEIFGFLMERLLAAGALDVALAPLQMKKNRPGTRLTVLARKEELDPLCAIILSESTAIGVRYYPVRRVTLARTPQERETSLGRVQVKVLENGRVTPEYEGCRRLALEHGIPLIEVYRTVERETGGR